MTDCTSYRNIACLHVRNHLSASNREVTDLYRCSPEPTHNPEASFLFSGRRFTELEEEIDWLDRYSLAATRYVPGYCSDVRKKCPDSGMWNEGRRFWKFKARHGLKQKRDCRTEVIETNSVYASRVRHACRSIDRKNQKLRSVFQYVVCGHVDNASCSIPASGIDTSAGGRTLVSVALLDREKTCRVD